MTEPEKISEWHVMRILTLDPVHVGVGQDLMGEVDLPIDREPETKVPRIPGPTLKGGFRSHAKWKLKMLDEYPAGTHCPGERPRQEGDEEEAAEGFCGVHECPLCQTFGWSPYKQNKENKAGNEGRVFFRDARLAFFPAATDQGTVWFTTPGRAAAYLGLGPELTEDPYCQEWPELLFGMGECRALSEEFSSLEVGWMSIQELPFEEPEDDLMKPLTAALKNGTGLFPVKFWKTVAERTVLLDETNFYRVVESCLERRTCNRIDDDTGTVVKNALFSYEAIPRYALLYSRYAFEDATFRVGERFLPDVCNLAREGLSRMGIGGMQTRGLGSVLVEPFGTSRPATTEQDGEEKDVCTKTGPKEEPK